MKKILFLSLLTPVITFSYGQKFDKETQAKLLQQFAEAGCKCVDSINTFNKTKTEIAAGISSCIDKQTSAYQLASKLFGIQDLQKNTKDVNGKKQIDISINVNKDSKEYKEYYYELERYMRANCKTLEGKMSATDEQGEASLSKNREAAEFYNLALDETEKEHYKEAIGYYEKAVRLDAAFTNAWDNMGLCYRRLKEYDKAIDAYKKSLAINPRGLMPLQNIAVVYQFTKEYRKAIEAYKQLAEVDRENPEVYFGMGQVYSGYLNDYEQGLDNMCKAYNLYTKQKSPYRSDAEQFIQAIYVDMKKQGKEAKFNEILRSNNISPK